MKKNPTAEFQLETQALMSPSFPTEQFFTPLFHMSIRIPKCPNSFFLEALPTPQTPILPAPIRGKRTLILVQFGTLNTFLVKHSYI